MRRSGVTLALAVLLVLASASAAVAQTTTTTTGASVLDKVKITIPSGAGTTAPVLKFAKPLNVKQSTHKVISEGAGDQLTQGQLATVNFVEVDTRTGKVVRSSYGATPQTVQLDPASGVPPLIEGLLATKVGGQVLVALAPKDYAKKLQGAVKGVKATDTLLFLMSPTKVTAARATGTAVPPVDGLPTVTLDAAGKPTVAVPSAVPASTSLVVQPLIKGDGPVVTAGQSVLVHYTGVVYATGKQFDS